MRFSEEPDLPVVLLVAVVMVVVLALVRVEEEAVGLDTFSSDLPGWSGVLSEGVIMLEVVHLGTSGVLLRVASFRAVQTLSDGLEVELMAVVEVGEGVEELRGRLFIRPLKEALNSQASAGVRSPFIAGSGRP